MPPTTAMPPPTALSIAESGLYAGEWNAMIWFFRSGLALVWFFL
jgi:hypothetical protein